MPAFDGSNPHPLYIFLLFLAAGAMIFGFMGLLLWNNRRKGYGRLEPSGGPSASAPAPGRTERPRSGENSPASTNTPPPPAAHAAQQPDAPARPVIASFHAVWEFIGVRCIHLLIVGETHSGKSTSARAVLAGRIAAGDAIAILDPHGDPEAWRGIRAIGAGRNFAAIETAMVELLAEMTRRYQARANDSSYKPEPLSIFVDEWPAIQTACKKTAAQFITELAQEGRKVGMRLVMLTQSDLVASLGIEGKGDIRSNFTMLLLGGKASARADVSGLTWPAAVRRGEGEAYPAITDPMPSHEPMTEEAKIWRVGSDHRPLPMKTPPAAEVEPNLDPLWEKFLSGADLLEPETDTGSALAGGADFGQKLILEPVSEPAVLPDTAAVEPVPAAEPAAVAVDTSSLPQDELSIIVRALLGAGLSRNKVIAHVPALGGNRAAALAKIRYAMGEVEA